jgi:hypothetical protein
MRERCSTFREGGMSLLRTPQGAVCMRGGHRGDPENRLPRRRRFTLSQHVKESSVKRRQPSRPTVMLESIEVRATHNDKVNSR